MQAMSHIPLIPLQGQALADALLNPRSVALVGASDDASKTAGRPQQFLRRAGFTGKVYPINPKRSTVQGAPAWPTLSALPEVPEHVFVLTPARLNAEVNKALTAPDVRETLVSQGAVVLGGSSADFRQYVGQEVAHWGKLLKTLKISMD